MAITNSAGPVRCPNCFGLMDPKEAMEVKEMFGGDLCRSCSIKDELDRTSPNSK